MRFSVHARDSRIELPSLLCKPSTCSTESTDGATKYVLEIGSVTAVTEKRDTDRDQFETHKRKHHP